MLRVVILLSLYASGFLGIATAQNKEDTVRFPSTIGSLNLYMRHEGPTGPRRGPPVLILRGATFPSGNAAGWKHRRPFLVG
jgi:hypothetical protein